MRIGAKRHGRSPYSRWRTTLSSGQVDDVDRILMPTVCTPTRNDPEAPALRESGGRLPDQADEACPMGFGDSETGGKVLAAVRLNA